MNSPNELPVDYKPVLEALTAGYGPCADINIADEKISTLTFQTAIAEHMGLTPDLKSICDWLTGRGFYFSADDSVQLVWLFSFKK